MKARCLFKPDLPPLNGSDSNSFPLEARKNEGAILENKPPSFSKLKVRASREKKPSNMTAFIGGKSGFNLLLLSLCCFFHTGFAIPTQEYDLTIVGVFNSSDGLGGQTISLIDGLKDTLSINVIDTREDMYLVDVSESSIEIILSTFEQPGKVSIFEDALWYYELPYYEQVPDSEIKIAYSMLESSRIPENWAEILNKHFDLVAVPDNFLVKVYQDSGVQIPIFVLPLPVNGLNDLINIGATFTNGNGDRELIPTGVSLPGATICRPIPGLVVINTEKSASSRFLDRPFVFGTTVNSQPRKNLNLLIEAFNEEFNNSEDVILKINSRDGLPLTQSIESSGPKRIFFNLGVLSRSEYVAFIRSFDCYVNIAKGEGFSHTPREALALQLPCILTNNTGQMTICNSGLVRAVPSEIEEPADYEGLFGGEGAGNYFNCSKEDVRSALRDVYQNYTAYSNKAKKGPEWVSQYCWESLKKKYLNLIKPQNIVLGDRNEVTDTSFVTNSTALYQKYLQVFIPKPVEELVFDVVLVASESFDL